MRVLTFSSLYPSTAQPRHGIFVEHRMRQLVAAGGVEVRVIAPVARVPLRHLWRVSPRPEPPATEHRHGIAVCYPRFLWIPRLLSWLNPLIIALCVLPAVRRLQHEFDFDVIDAHFLFPDAAAAALLGIWFNRPVIATARGTDANVFAHLTVPGAWIRWLGRRAAALGVVSAALRDELLRAGIDAEKVHVLRNGVDLDLFRPLDRRAVREALGFRHPTLLSVGHLLPAKGHHLVIDALTRLPEHHLVIVGDGAARGALDELAHRLGVSQRVRFVPVLGQDDLARHYAAADILVLASEREGLANVLLEAVACGTPVIATDVGGNGEVVTSPAAGLLIGERASAAIAEAVLRLSASPPGTLATRAHAEQFGWAATTAKLRQVLEAAVAGHRQTPRPGAC